MWGQDFDGPNPCLVKGLEVFGGQGEDLGFGKGIYDGEIPPGRDNMIAGHFPYGKMGG
jgi:hypothetical protein